MTLVRAFSALQTSFPLEILHSSLKISTNYCIHTEKVKQILFSYISTKSQNFPSMPFLNTKDTLGGWGGGGGGVFVDGGEGEWNKGQTDKLR